MENTQPYKIIELRQSPTWSEYLAWLGWQCQETLEQTKIHLYKLLFFTVTKIQRPHPLDDKELDEIEAICRRHKALFIKIEPNRDQDLKLLLKKGYKANYYPFLPPSTLIIDLTKDKETLRQELSKSAKYGVSRAQREGAQAKIYKNPSTHLLVQFHKLLLQSSSKNHISCPNLKDITKKVELFGNNAFLVVVENKEGNLVCGNLYVGYLDCVWFLHGGIETSARKGKWGYELLFKSIYYLKDAGYSYLDLEGLDDERFKNFTTSWGGFSHFKEKFGGTRIMYPTPYIKILNQFLILLSKIYKNLPF